jgi:purine-nucleoside phosphorylase
MSTETPRITHDDTQAYRRHVDDAAQFLRDEGDAVPPLGLVIGAGLDGIADALEIDTTLAFPSLPHAPHDTDARLILGSLDDTPLVALQGPLHLHDGYTPRQVAFPIRVLATAGVDTLLVTQTAGGLNPQYAPSDVMLVTDHINFQGANPLVGPNVADWGPRFPDMSEPYDTDLRDRAEHVALSAGIRLHQGVYLAVLGPHLETDAEYRMLRAMGADAVGTGAVSEVIAARHMSMRVCALSVITDRCLPDALQPVSVDDMQSAADDAIPTVTRLLRGLIAEPTPAARPQ